MLPIHRLCDLIGSRNTQVGLPNGRYVRAVPEPYTAGKIIAAWAVLTGRAAAVKWPEPGELEDALNR